MKVQLLRERDFPNYNPEHKTFHVTQAYPFFRSAYGQRVHRVRSGGVHNIGGEHSHTHFALWCGQHGFLSHRKRKGELFSQAPEGAIFCAACEGKAIGAGLDGARIINGRQVIFQPRI